MRVGLIVGVLALGLFLAFRGCFGGSSTSWNQRLTLVIETPQGEVRGSSVTRVENVTSKDLLAPGLALRSTYTGEAVAVEVLPGRWLFALLSGEGGTDAGHWVYSAFDLNEALDANGYPSYGMAIAKLRAQPLDVPVPLPADGMPLLVTFDDITKAETVREVEPENLAAVFGEGVRLKVVTLEITDEAMTEGVVETLPFWTQLVEQRTFSGLQFYDPKRPASLNYLTYDSLKMIKP